jgi:glycosyltransferase involved in cell wall biosynthesis
MRRVVAFRPGLAGNRTAFEAEALLYKTLQREYDYEFEIVIADGDSFSDPELATRSLPSGVWTPTVPRMPVYLRRDRYRRHIDPLFDDADLVLTADPTLFMQGVLGIRRAHKTDTPVWIEVSKTIADPEPHWPLIRPVVKRTLADASGVIVTAPKCLERFRDLGIFSERLADRTTVMGHPVDTDRFSPTSSEADDGSIRILTVSRLVPEKGLLYILEAVTPILKRRERATFQILGSGPLEPLLRREASDRGIESSVEFLETVPHEEVSRILAEADIFVNHAVSIDGWEEFFGVANLEAMACGLPCVISDCGAIPYVIRDRDVAEVTPQRNVTRLSRQIERLVDDEERRETLGRRAREYVADTYAATALAERYQRMIERGLERAG